MIYLLTVAAMDSEIANPLWHSFIILSTVEKNQKVRVVETYGFYGLPSTTRIGWKSRLKRKLGIDTDFWGNHGILRHEELRYLDLGYGLHGVTFELSEEQFQQVQGRCHTQVKEQNTAIQEVVTANNLQPPSENYRIYPFEQYSPLIFELEKIKSQQHGLPSRLKPFDLDIEITRWGPSLKNSHTCKSMIVELLQGILTPEQIDRITENGNHRTVPRRSGKMEQLFLHSSGPLREHTKKSGNKVLYRSFDDPDTELHWTLPPQEIEVLNDETAKLLILSPDYIDEARSAINKLQQVEWLFINAKLETKYKPYQIQLLEKIRQCYQYFSFVTKPQPTRNHPGFLNFFLNVLSLPRNVNEKRLFDCIQNANSLLNRLYISAVNGYIIDDNLQSETEVDEHSTEYNSLEAVSNYLSTTEKRTLCHILGRNYVEPLEIEEANITHSLSHG